MISLDEPLNLKISSRERVHRTSICAPLRVTRTRAGHSIRDPNTIFADSLTSKLDLSVCSSSPPSPHSSTCSSQASPLSRESEISSYQDGGTSPPLPGFRFFLPLSGNLPQPASLLSGRCHRSHDSSEPADEQLACRWLRCHLLFECLQDLVDHVTEFHVKPERSTGYCCHWEGCTRRGRGFNARYKMLIHIRTHTNEKPHQCSICNKSFSRLENLKIHTRSHTGEKPYACPYEGCSKRYSNSSDRFKHTRTHYEDRPYCCKMAGCPKRYTDPSSLRKHIKAHGHTVPQASDHQLNAVDPLTSFGNGRADVVVPGAALALLHAFTGTSPLDLSLSAGCMGGLGQSRKPLLNSLLLPSLIPGGKQRLMNRNDDEGMQCNTLSWVFIPPRNVMLKQAVVS